MTTKRIETITLRLQTVFAPSILEVIDESHQHIGHKGAASGAGHFKIRIASTCFENHSKLAAHRLIYTALADMLPHEIHALSIETLA